MEVLEPEQEARRKIAEAKLAEIQLSDDLPESTGENELKNTLSEPSPTDRGAESKGLIDWVHNVSVGNGNQSELNFLTISRTHALL